MTEKNTPKLPGEPIRIGTRLALDIGTETVGAYLYDVASGNCIAATGAENAQKIFGEDLMSRIAYAENDQKYLRETAVIREQVYDLILELCKKAEEETGKSSGFADIHYVSIAGNTVMEHLYAAVSPKTIGIPPYLPITLFGEEMIAEPTMYYCPCVSGFVGGDITAGLMSAGVYKNEEKTLYIDLGKGFGMALGNKDGFLCSAGAEMNEIPQMLARMRKEKGIGQDDIKKVVLAGAFGDEENALKAALKKKGFPEKMLDAAAFVGNAAGYGACMALSAENRETLKKIASLCKAIN